MMKLIAATTATIFLLSALGALAGYGSKKYSDEEGSYEERPSYKHHRPYHGGEYNKRGGGYNGPQHPFKGFGGGNHGPFLPPGYSGPFPPAGFQGSFPPQNGFFPPHGNNGPFPPPGYTGPFPPPFQHAPSPGMPFNPWAPAVPPKGQWPTVWAPVPANPAVPVQPNQWPQPLPLPAAPGQKPNNSGPVIALPPSPPIVLSNTPGWMISGGGRKMKRSMNAHDNLLDIESELGISNSRKRRNVEYAKYPATTPTTTELPPSEETTLAEAEYSTTEYPIEEQTSTTQPEQTSEYPEGGAPSLREEQEIEEEGGLGSINFPAQQMRSEADEQEGFVQGGEGLVSRWVVDK